MNDGWNTARRNFTDDDGSLPGIEFRNLQPESVQRLAGYFFRHGKLMAKDVTLWHNQLQADVPLIQVDDPAGLVVSGTADPFHCCFQLLAPGLETIPVLGLYVFQDLIEIDYRMGTDWNPHNVDCFFRLLAHLKSLATEACVESADFEGLPFPDDFKAAFVRYVDTLIANDAVNASCGSGSLAIIAANRKYGLSNLWGARDTLQ